MQSAHRQAHRLIWLILSVIVIGGFVAGLLVRQDFPAEETRFETVPTPN